MGKRLYPKGFTKLYADEYSIWLGMRQRCNNPSNEHYPRYGGRGITICPRWQRFDFFMADMGVRPGSEYSIERVNNNDGYRPENCCWIKLVDQVNNRANTRPLIERIHPRLAPVFRRTIEVIGLGDDATWEDIADGWLPRHLDRPLY
jgi:hypothetical protein